MNFGPNLGEYGGIREGGLYKNAQGVAFGRWSKCKFMHLVHVAHNCVTLLHCLIRNGESGRRPPTMSFPSREFASVTKDKDVEAHLLGVIFLFKIFFS